MITGQTSNVPFAPQPSSFAALAGPATPSSRGSKPQRVYQNLPVPRQAGFSLIEVLVAAVLLAIGLVGLSLMMMQSVEGTVAARNQTLAAMEASSLAELILMNPGSLGHFVNPVNYDSDCLSPSGCDTEQWAAGNLARWQSAIASSLADARGLVCFDASPNDGDITDPACDQAGAPVVKVFWTGMQHAGSSSARLQRLALPVNL